MEQTCSQANQKTKNIFTEIPKNTLNKQTKFYGEEKNKSEVAATVIGEDIAIRYWRSAIVIRRENVVEVQSWIEVKIVADRRDLPPLILGLSIYGKVSDTPTLLN